MNIVSRKSSLSGEVVIPASKSHTIRAVLIASLAAGRSRISKPLESADTRSCVEAFRALGAQIETGEDWIVTGVDGKLRVPPEPIDVGNSGTTLYLGLGVAALARDWITFTGDAQIRRRPAGNLLTALQELGAQVESSGLPGCAPLSIKGPLQGGHTAIRCPTSQYLSSLLLACPLASGESHIDVPELNERPYVEMTLSWLNAQNITYTHENMRWFRIPGQQFYDSFREHIRGDFSSATFFLCAAAICGGDVTLRGLDMNDAQGDKKVVHMLRQMGAAVDVAPLAIRVRGGHLKGCEFDLNATPDALPAMAVTACFAEGETRLINVPQARIKETDRIAVMAQAINALGGHAEELPDGLVIRGGGLEGGQASGAADHRVVMALAVAGLASRSPVTVDTAEAISVTFPNFVNLMQSLGARMESSGCAGA